MSRYYTAAKARRTLRMARNTWRKGPPYRVLSARLCITSFRTLAHVALDLYLDIVLKPAVLFTSLKRHNKRRRP
jgi:hypothetical protein